MVNDLCPAEKPHRFASSVHFPDGRVKRALGHGRDLCNIPIGQNHRDFALWCQLERVSDTICNADQPPRVANWAKLK
jgi:hypothetical protein